MVNTKYKVGDRVRIKSLDWYNENKTKRGFICFEYANFIPEMSRYCGEILTINRVVKEHKQYRMSECGFVWTDEMIEGLVEEETKPKDIGEVSDGYHTFNELYEYRMLYNAALFNEFAKQGLYDVHKSRKHSDGEYPFGDSNWFIVMAELPTGQISNHYEMKDWNKFQIPEKPLANKWDGHSPRDVADRLTCFTTPKKEYPKTYEECCKVLNLPVRDFDILYNMLDTMEIIYTNNLDRLLNSFRKLLICRDAYWKIAGEEMELGEHWEPDWDDDEWPDMYYISFDGKHIDKEKGYPCCNMILIFPTEEMQDAFYENFKELIEQCKELL